MMFNKKNFVPQRYYLLKERQYIKRNVKKSLEDLEASLQKLKGYETIAICPVPTQNSWQGVYTATLGLFGEAIFLLPQYYSKAVYSKDELDSLAKCISAIGVSKVVFSGYLPYFNTIIDCLNRDGVEVCVIYHGSHTTILEDPNAAKHFLDFIELLKNGRISRVGFVKKGMNLTFNKLLGMNCYPIHLKCNIERADFEFNGYDGINIGVLTHDGWRKNIYNQVSAALMVEEATVHLKEEYLTSYLKGFSRMNFHRYLASNNEFYSLLGSMSINMYVTFSECWGQFITESLALGVPCLASDVSAILDFDTELKKRLIVNEFDNDYAIYLKVNEVLEDLDWYKKHGPKYVIKVNQMADYALREFID